jgi:hypothetical protein
LTLLSEANLFSVRRYKKKSKTSVVTVFWQHGISDPEPRFLNPCSDSSPCLSSDPDPDF